MQRFGWTYDELQATPEDVINDAAELFRAQDKLREIEERKAQWRARA